MSALHFLVPGSPEWIRAWRILGMVPVNFGRGPVESIGAPDGEAWQYMGTETDGGLDIVVTGEGGAVRERGLTWIDGPCHLFRHRSHPGRGGDRVYVRIKATETRWTDDAALQAWRLAELAARVSS